MQPEIMLRGIHSAVCTLFTLGNGQAAGRWAVAVGKMWGRVK